MYRFFYNHEVSGDILFILINPDKAVTRHLSSHNVTALYAGDELVGINIFNISNCIKIHSSGMICSPNKEFVGAVNAILEGEKIPPLPSLANSGYLVGKITKLEEHPIDEKAQIVTISLGDKEVTTVSHYKNLALNELIVVETDGCITYNGSVFHKFVSRNIPNEVSICSPRELKMEDDGAGALLVTNMKEGSDFFLEEQA
jgi:tRNA-binding EMAP/Myf-like protein